MPYICLLHRFWPMSFIIKVCCRSLSLHLFDFQVKYLHLLIILLIATGKVEEACSTASGVCHLINLFDSLLFLKAYLFACVFQRILYSHKNSFWLFSWFVCFIFEVFVDNWEFVLVKLLQIMFFSYMILRAKRFLIILFYVKFRLRFMKSLCR